MSKDKIKFVREFVIRINPEPEKTHDAIVKAELAWTELTKCGYGEPKALPAVVAKNNSFYGALNEEQRVWFDRFWDAFNFKNGKEPAAKEWSRLGVLKPEQYQKIINAAAFEGNKTLPAGQSRKMAQGWLSEKRYEDEHHYATRQSVPAVIKQSAVERVRAANGLHASAQ